MLCFKYVNIGIHLLQNYKQNELNMQVVGMPCVKYCVACVVLRAVPTYTGTLSWAS